MVGVKESHSVVHNPRHVQMTRSSTVYELSSFYKHFPASVSHVQIAHSPSDVAMAALNATYARRLTHPTLNNAL